MSESTGKHCRASCELENTSLQQSEQWKYQGKGRGQNVGNTDGGFILHFIQWSLGIDSILMRLELVTRAFNSDSFCGLMVSQYGAVFASLRVGMYPRWIQ